MEYNKFLESIQTALTEQLTGECRITIHSIPKNNGQVMDGISIQRPGEIMAPTIYLNSFYEQYLNGLGLNEILTDILCLLNSNPAPEGIRPEQISQFEFVKDKIMFKVIHAASNEHLLQNLPYVPVLDLAVVFYLFLDRNATGQMTALIHKDHQIMWGVSEQELLELARINTPAAFPVEIKSMANVLKEIALVHLGDQYDESMMDLLLQEDEHPMPLYVLTNQSGLNGACCMLYPDCLEQFAEQVGSSLIILPSSIHEVLITPDLLEASYDDFGEMVTYINQREVPLEDQLSNQVYRYNRDTGELEIVTSSADRVGLFPTDCSQEQ
ncbi:MAG: DUF5688 family protein [Lachnospiraceae bacterium]